MAWILYRLGRWSYRRRRAVVALWLLALLGGGVAASVLAGPTSDAFTIPGFVPAFIRPLFCRGAGPFRWAALSGDPGDIAETDRAVLETFPRNDALARWIDVTLAPSH